MPLSRQTRMRKNTAQPARDGLVKKFKGRRRITENDRMFFTEQLSLLLETGINLHAGLQALQAQVQNPDMAKVITEMTNMVSEGKSFSFALSQYPDVFSQTYVNLIAASEGGGFMHEVMLQLLEMDEKRARLRATLKSAISYPVFLMVFAVTVVIFVLTVVFPKFADMFSQIEDQLPASTKMFMVASDLFINQWPLLIVGLVTVFLVVYTWLKSLQGQRILDHLKIRLPGVRDIYIKLYLVQSLRVMSLSLQNGVDVMETLGACKDVVKNSHYQKFISGVQARVEEGAGFAAGFRDSPFVPAVVEQMISTAEETGNLARVMGRLSDFYERELDKRMTTLSSMAEPIMLIVMGGVVGLLVTSLILPIFKLSRAVG